eukprot:CAMPEP_0184288812 /NCGR_PEP_ID=MMETSP1049-20130417/1282_1 /TAXON_ID=77928 /ORGANISM="Proteomonas sulcata, Strain CCMP704" /LENGTH=184 /DNA_ID=CAMNT_0026595355 /DNA_START=340 /DNA_END=894 /DNA_ORIENTATION=-
MQTPKEAEAQELMNQLLQESKSHMETLVQLRNTWNASDFEEVKTFAETELKDLQDPDFQDCYKTLMAAYKLAQKPGLHPLDVKEMAQTLGTSADMEEMQAMLKVLEMPEAELIGDKVKAAIEGALRSKDPPRVDVVETLVDQTISKLMEEFPACIREAGDQGAEPSEAEKALDAELFGDWAKGM